MRRGAAGRGITTAALLALALYGAAAAAGSVPAPAPDRQRALMELLRQDCGSCHGLTLQGGLGPALTPDALAGRPAELLRATITDGRPGTPMAPWRPFLSEAEAAWLVERLRQGIGDAP